MCYMSIIRDKVTTSRAENKIISIIFYPEAPCNFKLRSRLKLRARRTKCQIYLDFSELLAEISSY